MLSLFIADHHILFSSTPDNLCPNSLLLLPLLARACRFHLLSVQLERALRLELRCVLVWCHLDFLIFSLLLLLGLLWLWGLLLLGSHCHQLRTILQSLFDILCRLRAYSIVVVGNGRSGIIRFHIMLLLLLLGGCLRAIVFLSLPRYHRDGWSRADRAPYFSLDLLLSARVSRLPSQVSVTALLSDWHRKSIIWLAFNHDLFIENR